MIIIPDCNEKKNNNGWIFASFDMSCEWHVEPKHVVLKTDTGGWMNYGIDY